MSICCKLLIEYALVKCDLLFLWLQLVVDDLVSCQMALVEEEGLVAWAVVVVVHSLCLNARSLLDNFNVASWQIRVYLDL